MIFQIQHANGEYKIVLTAEQMEALALTEGAEVDLAPHTNGKPAPSKQRYATMDEVMEAYRRTEPKFAATYRELAK